jgi:hypothetical protein
VGVVFIVVVGLLWLYVVVTALRRQMFWHAAITVLAAGFPVFGGFAGNWCATGKLPGDELSCCGLRWGCLVGLATFVIMLAVIAVDMARRSAESQESTPAAD